MLQIKEWIVHIYLRETILIFPNKLMIKTLTLQAIKMLMRSKTTGPDAWIFSIFHSLEELQEIARDNWEV